MTKILLINPGHDNSHEKNKHTSYRKIHRDPPPIGLLYVGTYLKKNGFDVTIIDTHIEDNYKQLIKSLIQQNEYLFVGLSVIIGKFLKNAGELTDLLKDIKPDLTVVWGGIMASIMPDELLKEYKPDIIVRYEGEKTSVELATALLNNHGLEKINGISFIEKKKIIHNPGRKPQVDLDQYHIPNWELFGNKFNVNQIPYYFLIMSSRGCPFNCSFCYKHSVDVDQRKHIPPWRYRTANHVLEEVQYIHKKTRTRVFTFGDDNFFANKKRVIEILKYFRRNNFYIEECIGHINCLDDDIINEMSGVVQKFD